MSGDLLGSPKPKEMAAGAPTLTRRRWAEPMAVAQTAAECAGVEGEGGHSGGVAGFYWALPRHQRWRVTAAPRWVTRQTLPRRRHVILSPHHHAWRGTGVLPRHDNRRGQKC